MNKVDSSYPPVEVGQIRQLMPNRLDGSSRLVIIAEIDELDKTCLVFLLNNMVEAAIPRDVCLSKSKINTKFDLVLMTEYFSRANISELKSSKILGKLSENEIAKIRTISFNHPFGSLPDEILSEGISIGKFPVQKFDSVWRFRTSEFDNFRLLTFVRNKLSLSFSAKILDVHKGDISNFLDDIPLDLLFLKGRERNLVSAQ
jgi:hypothetical protein